MALASPTSSGVGATVQEQLDKYLAEVPRLSADSASADVLSFWHQKATTYNLLAPIAEDLICAPASQAFVERIFLCAESCGWLA